MKMMNRMPPKSIPYAAQRAKSFCYSINPKTYPPTYSRTVKSLHPQHPINPKNPSSDKFAQHALSTISWLELTIQTKKSIIP